MNAYCRIAATALCAIFFALPAAQAQDKFFYDSSLYVELDNSEDGDFRAHPRELTLKAGQHYRLELVNFSEGLQHVLIGPEFADSIITTGIRTYPAHVEIPGASLGKGLNLLPGARMEIYFQPQREGRYKLFCEDRAHTTGGIEVAINVVRTQ